MAILDIYPQTRQEEYLKKIADGDTQDVDALGEPQTRTEHYLRVIALKGAAGGASYTKEESDARYLQKTDAAATYETIEGAAEKFMQISDITLITAEELAQMWPESTGI